VLPRLSRSLVQQKARLRSVLWGKYLRAQTYLDTNGSLPSPPESVLDIDGEWDKQANEGAGGWAPLFGHYNYDVATGKPPEFRQDFFDDYSCACEDVVKDKYGPITGGIDAPTPDGWLELDIFPRDEYSSGNLGTIDIGGDDNSTAVIDRQIVDGVNEDDLSHYTDNQFFIPSDVNGDTGLSAGIKDALEEVRGQCRVFLLFDHMLPEFEDPAPGNQAFFYATEFVGVRIMDVKLTGSFDIKMLRIQKCNATLTGALADYTTPPGQNTTVFTPLILVE
jgi:hypothetical protein